MNAPLLGCRSPFCTIRVLVGGNDSSVNHDRFTIRLTSKGFENSLPYTAPVPPSEAGEDSVPKAKEFGQVPPGRARSVFPEDGFDDWTVAKARPPHSVLFTWQ